MIQSDNEKNSAKIWAMALTFSTLLMAAAFFAAAYYLSEIKDSITASAGHTAFVSSATPPVALGTSDASPSGVPLPMPSDQTDKLPTIQTPVLADPSKDTESNKDAPQITEPVAPPAPLMKQPTPVLPQVTPPADTPVPVPGTPDKK